MWLLRYLLFPFSILYLLITNLRNHLFDIGYTKSFKFEVKLIGVGNLSAGGTGKTPMIEYLIRLLKDQKKVATLSRGYGRRSSGFIIANDAQNSSLTGDEPRQYYLKFKEEIIVAVGEERALAIPEILYHKPDIEVILLDDAFQHRYVALGLNILLSDYNNLFYNDSLLPLGNLRESRRGAKRADILIITKCPEDITQDNMLNIRNRCYKYISKETPVYFSAISYLDPLPVFDNCKHAFTSNIVLFSGIGKSSYFEQYVKGKYNLVRVFKFSDHHQYSVNDLMMIKKQYSFKEGQDICLLTTEKDMVKIKELNYNPAIRELPLFYLPIEMNFIDQKQNFDDLIIKYISYNKN